MSILQTRHFLTIDDFSRDELDYVFKRTDHIKHKFKEYEIYQPLADRTLVMIFEKASTRTRLSFEAGMAQMGGNAIFMSTRDSQLGRGEPIPDAARVVSRMCDIVMIRTFEQETVERFAEYSRVPIINGLTNQHHPCQILADVYTYLEHRGPIQGKIVSWIGDSNNMFATWLQAARALDFTLHASMPQGYEPDPKLTEQFGKHLKVFKDPLKACEGADLVTSDVWTSMGFEDENEARRKAFAKWCVDTNMMAAANDNAIYMHCLPAHRGEEVTAEVIDGEQSVVWDEAENRMHVQKALLEYLLIGNVEN